MKNIQYACSRYCMALLIAVSLIQCTAFSGMGDTKSSSLLLPVQNDSEKVYPMNQIVVTATRSDKELFSIPREIVVLNKTELENRSIRSTPDALSESPSILVQKTNYGGGAPSIRGLIGNQVLILVDGIRLNNSTFRFGPNQYLNTISPAVIQRIEVVEGPGSVLYGSDALGGTINLITNTFSTPILSSLTSVTSFATADKSIVQQLRYETETNNIRVKIGGGYKNFKDLGTGSGYLRPTGYSGFDGNAQLLYRFDENHRFTASYQMTELSDVPRTDRIVAGTDIKNIYNPQRQELGYISYEGVLESTVIQNIKATVSYNRQKEGRESISAAKPFLQTKDLDVVKTYGVSVELHSLVNSKNLLTYGFEYYYDNISSRRQEDTLTTGGSVAKKPQFPDGATYATVGAYIQDEIELSPLSIIGGLRYSAFKFKGMLDAPFGETVSTPNDITYSLNATYFLSPTRLAIVGGIAEGFRAPNVDDIAVFGKSGSGAGARFDVPSPGVNPEQSFTYEFGVKYRESGTGASIFYYRSYYNDMIVPKPGFYQGEDSLSGIPVYQRFNVGEATIQGVNITGFYELTPEIRLRGEASWTEGENTSDNEPLSRIPPKRGIIGITYKQESYWIEYYQHFAEYQERLSTSDKKDGRIGPGGTPGYSVVNLRGGYTFSPQISTTITFENIFDRLYKMHGSGVYSPGRNLIMSLSIGL